MNERFQVAVFPLPRVVAYPGHALQFHVFEPRYRKMVNDCVENGLWLGVAQGHAVRRHKGACQQTVEEFLNSNQENYQPAPVFGAGPVSLIKQFPDGRSIIEVRVLHRVEVVEWEQQVPYMIAQVAPREDLVLDRARELELIGDLLSTAHRILGRRAVLFNELSGIDDRHPKCLNELIFSILKWFVIEAAEGQRIIATDDPAERCEIILTWMRYFLSRMDGAHAGEVAPEPRHKETAARNAQVIAVDFHARDHESHGKTKTV